MKNRIRNIFILILISTFTIFVLSLTMASAQQEGDESIFDNYMDPDLNESPIQYRTLDSGDSDTSEAYSSVGLSIEEFLQIIIDKLNALEKELKLILKKETKDEIAKTILDKLLNEKEINEKLINEKIINSIINEILKSISKRIEELEKELKFNIKKEIKDEINKTLIKVLLEEKDCSDENIDKKLREEIIKRLTIKVVDKINALEKELKLKISSDEKKAIAKIALSELLDSNDFSDKNIDSILRKTIKTFFDKDKKSTTSDKKDTTSDKKDDTKKVEKDKTTPKSGEIIHKVLSGDTLADLSFKYYSNDDRKRGAHWIHIYDKSVEKGYIDPKTQPIVPYEKYEGFVKLNIGQNVVIPYYDKYPSAKDLLNKYGFTIGDNGEIKELETGLPINIDIDN